jgi:hypothetical protein
MLLSVASQEDALELDPTSNIKQEIAPIREHIQRLSDKTSTSHCPESYLSLFTSIQCRALPVAPP